MDVMTVGAAGRILGLSPQRIRQLVDGGQLHATRTTTGMRLLERAVVEDLAAKRAERHAPAGRAA